MRECQEGNGKVLNLRVDLIVLGVDQQFAVVECAAFHFLVPEWSGGQIFATHIFLAL